MQAQVEKTWSVSLAELYLLLYGKTPESMPLFEQISDYVPDESEIAQAMFSLVKNKIATQGEEGAFILSDGMKCFLEQVTSFRVCIAEYTKEPYVNKRCIYRADDSGFAEITPDHVLEGRYLLRSGIKVETPVESILEEYQGTSTDGVVAEELPAINENTDEFRKDERILLMTECYPRGKKRPESRSLIVKGSNGFWIVRDDLIDGKRAVERYSNKRLYAIYQ